MQQYNHHHDSLIVQFLGATCLNANTVEYLPGTRIRLRFYSKRKVFVRLWYSATEEPDYVFCIPKKTWTEFKDPQDNRQAQGIRCEIMREVSSTSTKATSPAILYDLIYYLDNEDRETVEGVPLIPVVDRNKTTTFAFGISYTHRRLYRRPNKRTAMSV